ncbi:MAG: HAD family hydrolase [Oceanicoccus sp.]
MHHVMFDVDGTLVESFEFDEACYLDAVYRALGDKLDNDWSQYPHISDAGILDYHLAKKDRLHERIEIQASVKSTFIANIKEHLAQSPTKEVDGAAQFITYLKRRKNVSLSIATGGWGETARLKLTSAGIDVSGIPMVSSNDHFSRIEIMKMALRKAAVPPEYDLTYFGDAEWDKQACEALAFNFVLVGNRIEHTQAISDFTSPEQACKFIGL